MIKAQGFTKRYGSTLAVDGLPFRVEPGKITGFVDPDMAGTTTRCQALFASTLQRSDAPGADVVAEAITAAVRQLGAGGCIGRMAQEFGDHPEAAAARMRWIRSLLSRP